VADESEACRGGKQRDGKLSNDKAECWLASQTLTNDYDNVGTIAACWSQRRRILLHSANRRHCVNSGVKRHKF